jgi:hypothetical protein
MTSKQSPIKAGEKQMGMDVGSTGSNDGGKESKIVGQGQQEEPHAVSGGQHIVVNDSRRRTRRAIGAFLRHKLTPVVENSINYINDKSGWTGEANEHYSSVQHPLQIPPETSSTLAHTSLQALVLILFRLSAQLPITIWRSCDHPCDPLSSASQSAMPNTRYTSSSSSSSTSSSTTTTTSSSSSSSPTIKRRRKRRRRRSTCAHPARLT